MILETLHIPTLILQAELAALNKHGQIKTAAVERLRLGEVGDFYLQKPIRITKV
jgi:hypothetical protein